MLQSLPVVGVIPSDGTKPSDINAARVESCSAVRVLSKCVGGSGEAYLLRYEPQLDEWWPWGEYAPMKPDASKLDGRFSGRYALEETGPVYFVLLFGPGVTPGESHHIEGVRL